ncbi:MAG TPA: transglycosylase domain-containing protein [Nocardioidaceae bacterium]|nr:transglycosylase domain-containing protein [Nocardioidaceae bacterium]
MPARHPDDLTSSRVINHLVVMLGVAAAMGLLVAGLVIPFAGVAGVASRNLADSMDKLPADLTAAPLAQRTRVLANDGTVIATWYDQNRVNVRLDQVSEVMKQAILSIEDARFYEHGALDIKGTIRAFITNQANSGVVQGGSSITQQMVKMTLALQGTAEQRKAATEDSYRRKWNELRYAVAFEQKYSKQWILERYLNIAYFGDGAWGIEAAARHFFSKPASKLKLGEAAVLAGLVKNPTRYDPTNNTAESRSRRDVVLNRMAELNVITAEQAIKAKKRKLGLKITKSKNGCVEAMDSQASWFCDYLREYLLQDRSLGRTVRQREHLLNSGGLTIHTTLDPRFQIAANNSVRAHVFPTDNAIGGLAMVVPGTGEVRALAQSRPMGRDKKKGQTFLNYVVPTKYGDSGGFQAGSTFKVFTLAAAITQGMPLSTRINAPQSYTVPAYSLKDCPGRGNIVEDWPVSNSTGSGSFDLYSGTQQSVNTFFAQLEQRTGLCEPVTLAQDMGVDVPDRDRVGPFTLGVTYVNPLTMAGVYATFAARGVYCEPRPVTQILDSRGKVVADYPDKCNQVLRSDVADAVNDILRGVVEPGGFGYALNPGQPSAGKTGTRQDNKSVWFDGYTPDLAAAAMIAGANSLGHEISLNGQTVGGLYITRAFGSTNAGPIWGDAMKAIAQYLPDTDFTEPSATTIAGRVVTVPSVQGLSPSTAARILRKAGFLPSVGAYVDSSFPRGTVAYLSVRSGSQIGTGSPIVIYVSNGTPPRQPDPGGGDAGGGGTDKPGKGNGRGNKP